MVRVLVTGGLGFIGSHTVDMLIDSGYDVTVLDNLERQVHFGKFPNYKNPKVKYIIGDIRFKKHWLNALEDVDTVIHLAGAVGTGQSFWQPRKYLSINTIGTATLFELLENNTELKKRITKIIVASSKSIYGEGAYKCEEHGSIFPESRAIEDLERHKWEPMCPICKNLLHPIPLPESKPIQNPNPYSLGKYTTENLALQYSKLTGIKTLSLRYFNVYGPRQSLNNPYTGVMAIFLSRMKNGNAPVLYEDGQQMRDYIYVEDVAKVNVKSIETGEGVINIGTGVGTSLLSLVEILNKRLGTNVEPNITSEFRVGDNRHDFADNKKLKESLHIYNFKKLKDGINNLVEWSEGIKSVDRFNLAEKERKKYMTRISNKEI